MYLIFCLPAGKSLLQGFWNVSNSSSKGVQPFCSDAASVLNSISRPQELQLSLVAVCNTRQRNGSTELQGQNLKTPSEAAKPEKYKISTNAVTPVLRLLSGKFLPTQRETMQRGATSICVCFNLLCDTDADTRQLPRKSLQNTQLH